MIDKCKSAFRHSYIGSGRWSTSVNQPSDTHTLGLVDDPQVYFSWNDQRASTKWKVSVDSRFCAYIHCDIDWLRLHNMVVATVNKVKYCNFG